MKKLITLSSLAAMLGFAVVLANANDVSSENPSDAQTYDSQSSMQTNNLNSLTTTPTQSAGQAADLTNPRAVPPFPTCTDDNNVTFNKGDMGYIHCQNIHKLQTQDLPADDED
jgi:hypothetical protein